MARPKALGEALPGLFRVVWHFRPYIWRHRALIAGSWLALLATVGLRLLEPWPLKFVFDYVIARQSLEVWKLPSLDPEIVLVLAALGLVAIAGLRATATYWSDIGFALVGSRVLAEVRAVLYRHLQYLSLSFHSKARTGDLTLRVVGDIGVLKDVTVTALLPLLANVLILAGMLAVMFWLNSQLALLALVTVPLFGLTATRLSRRIQEVSRTQRRREGDLAATAAESLGAIRVVQALSLEEPFAHLFANQNNKELKQSILGRRLAARLERSVDLLTAAATALVLWYGARLVMNNAITAGDLIVFLSYLRSAFKPLQDLAKYTSRLAKAAAAGERVLNVLKEEPQVRDLPGALPAPDFQGQVLFEGVSFSYDNERQVLKDIDLQAGPSQWVAIVGPSGHGKSTLLSLLLRLYDPTAGRVMIDGRDIREYTIATLRAQISVVLQDNLLFAASVLDNIAYGAPGATPAQVEAVARLANAHEFIQALPEGYDTILGERGITLSGGQRQRLAIARAAIRDAPILILDEPTTSLDEQNQRVVIEALERLGWGRTTFLVTHHLDLAARADLIVYLEGGKVLERGSHDELLRMGGRYAALYQLQAAGGIGSGRVEDTLALSR